MNEYVDFIKVSFYIIKYEIWTTYKLNKMEGNHYNKILKVSRKYNFNV